MEQRLARQAHNLEVVGSIPTGATFCTIKPPSDGGFLMRLMKISCSFWIEHEGVARRTLFTDIASAPIFALARKQ